MAGVNIPIKHAPKMKKMHAGKMPMHKLSLKKAGIK